MHKKLVAVTLTTLVLAGCTSTSHGSPHAATSREPSPSVVTVPTSAGASSTVAEPSSALPTPSSSITASSTATPWTTAVALAHATSISNAANVALRRLGRVSATAPLDQARQALNAIVTADTAMVEDLADGAWPTSVRPEVNAYLAGLDTERRLMASLQRRTSVAAMQQDGTTIAELLGQVAAAGKALLTALSSK